MLFSDGGTGTILQSLGLGRGELPEMWNLTHPDEIVQLHTEYLNCGSDIIYTNTFGANGFKYPDQLKEIIEAAVSNALKAKENTGRPDAFIALDIGPTGKLLEPMGDLPFEKAVQTFAEIIRIGSRLPVDLIQIETMSSGYEAKAAVLAARENSDLPICVTVTFDANGKMLTGEPVEAVAAMLEGLRVDALGVNCSLGPKQMIPIVRRMREVTSLPLIVKPNAGLPVERHGRTYYDIDADQFTAYMKEIADIGIQIAGGCCGTTPVHMRKMIAALKEKPFSPAVKKTCAYVSSYGKAVEIGEKTVIIGERINPTGKKKLKEALRSHDMNYILQEALRQEEAGAQILDVNLGLPEINEPEMMEEAVKAIQSVTNLPLQIDTSDIEALERGLRIYNGKAMVNSVNGKKENIDAVMPLVAKYGGVLVGLCLDEEGIPEDPEKRIAIARRIYEAADRYGIPRQDIVIDTLALTISSDNRSALRTLDALRTIHEEMHGHTVLGVSNISFGLPQRKRINSTFLSMAMQNGLSCAIINPLDEAMMSAYRSSLALLGKDENCMEYINAFSQQQEERPAQVILPAAGTHTLFYSVEHGLSAQAEKCTAELLKNKDGLSIINEDLIPALDKVGKGFENGTIFLPQLLMSADAAKAAFAVIKNNMPEGKQENRGTVIMATVKGDIHDIGKNIVKVMLENYGFQVMDLGKDVPPEVIAEAAVQNKIRLVGLSALMTTTVVSMEETIKLLRKVSPGTKIIVGGAVLTQEYADQIGADAYGKDAMATVRYAETVFEAS